MKKLILTTVLFLSHLETFAEEDKNVSSVKKQELVCMVKDSKRKQTREVRFDLSLPSGASPLSTRVLEAKGVEGLKVILDEGLRQEDGRISEVKIQLPFRSLQSRFQIIEDRQLVAGELVDMRDSSNVKNCKYEETSLEKLVIGMFPKLKTGPAKVKDEVHQSQGRLLSKSDRDPSNRWDFFLPNSLFNGEVTTSPSRITPSTR